MSATPASETWTDYNGVLSKFDFNNSYGFKQVILR